MNELPSVEDLQAQVLIILAGKDDPDGEAKQALDEYWGDWDFLYGMVRGYQLDEEGYTQDEALEIIQAEALQYVSQRIPRPDLTELQAEALIQIAEMDEKDEEEAAEALQMLRRRWEDYWFMWGFCRSYQLQMLGVPYEERMVQMTAELAWLKYNE